MIKFITLSLLLFSYFTNFSQNLIENGSFEQLSEVPDNADQVKYAIGWNDMTHPWNNSPGGSPDLYSTLGSWFTPRGISGGRYNIHNNPQDGRNFVGMLIDVPITENLHIREYIQYIFPKPLEANVKYRLSYYYTTGILESNRVDILAFNCINAHFTKDIIDHLSATQLYIPETTTKQESILKSMETWSKVTHEFVLEDQAICMSFGNFCLSSQLKHDTIAKSNGDPFYKNIYDSYYLFDNFSLEKVRQPIQGDTLYQVCKGNELELKIAGDRNNKWYNSQKQLVAQNIERFTIEADTSTSYTVIGTTDTLKIQVEVTPNPQKIYTDQTLCYEDNLLLLAQNLPFYDSLEVSPALENHSVTEAGIYFLEYKLGKCYQKDSIQIQKIDCEVVLEYPNIFTPNGDDKNEVFLPIKQKNIASASLQLYNRWGKEIFFTEDISKGWDGAGASAGVYYYVCHFVGIFGTEAVINGWVVVLE